ncbi:LysR family transcriptional regulator [Sulfuriflexus mobilis]|uniref:LysR family transcriptional regulator n=1 Tax=Sulfuriflexus mobilis TaxID=1811807 RepID=UPI0018D54740|nr:LysR family transcriptional regulator [Sulfuriflexus mobilis]
MKINKLRQLPRLLAFAAVAEKGSFTRAAEVLGVTKSAVSQQISLLEEELGIRVLNRTTRGVSLTALGESLLSQCQLLQDQTNRIFTDVVNAGANPQGRFAVTFPHAFESNIVIPAIEQLCLEFPGLEPELIVSDKALDIVSNNLDVAIYSGELPDSSYRALPIGAMTEIFCATPLYLHRAASPVTPESLGEHRWLATSWQQQKMPIWHVDCNKSDVIQLNPFARANTLACALKMALRHMGVVLLADVVAKPYLKTGELVHIAHRISGPHWPVYTLHAYHGEKPVHLTRFHQLVSRFFMAL